MAFRVSRICGVVTAKRTFPYRSLLQLALDEVSKGH